MVRITVAGEDLDLLDGFTLSIEETSPIFNDIGSQSIAVNLPDTLRNRRILGFPRRPDAAGCPASTSVACTVVSGAYVRSGIMNTDSAADDGLSVSIGFDNSRAYDAWRSKALSEVETLPCFRFRDMDAVAAEMRRIYSGVDPRVDDLAVFPIRIASEEVKEKLDGEPKEGEVHEELLNDFFNDLEIFLPAGEKEREVMRVIDGCEAMITVPNGYGVSPFVRVWRILEATFSDLGLRMDRNPFREDVELARLVVLNNTADTLCACTLDYAELMPDCTVEEFLYALFVRFGFIYRTDFDSGVAHVCLVREIMGMEACLELDSLLTQEPDSEFRTPQYVRLSAATGLEGAAPFTERLEDFIPDLSILGTEWPDSPDGPESPDVPDGKDPEQGFWPIDRKSKKQESLWWPFWEGRTGTLWRQDYKGSASGGSSSSFFAWDPRPDGCEPLDLTSADECCPNNGSLAGPGFLVGARHRHTRTKGSVEETESKCPLSFMFALLYNADPQHSRTEGLLSAYNDQDEDPNFVEDVEEDGRHDLSLFFQFRIGHYAKFWKDFDLMLRGADRRINVSARMGKDELRRLDVLAPVRLRGMPMLIDTAETAIGDGLEVDVDFVLVPMTPPTADDDRFAREVTDFPPPPTVLSEKVEEE